MFLSHEIYCHSMVYFHLVKIFSFDKKRMSHDFRRHGHQAFMAWSQSSLFINMATVSDSLWDFFLGLVNLLNIYENYSLDIYLDFPSAAILFNQLDITVSVLRSVSGGVTNLSLPCADQLQELCSCFSEIQLYW